MIARLSSLVVWGLVALAAVAWGLRLGGRSTPVPPHAAVAEAGAPRAGDLARLLGTPPAVAVEQAPAPVAETRFRLVGVVAPRSGRTDGVALIAVDGNPPRTLRQGRELEPGLVLKTVSHRRVELAGAGRPPVVLELPPLAEAQRGRPGELPVPGALPTGGGSPALPRAAGLPTGAPPTPVPVPGQPSPGAVGADGLPSAPPVPGAPPAGNRLAPGIAPGAVPPPVTVDAPPEPAPATR